MLHVVDDVSEIWTSSPPTPRRLPKRPLITSIGGSASCPHKNYAHFVGKELNTTFTSNPSQGYSGSDYAALYFDSLIDNKTDVLIWEFAINDFTPLS